MVKMIVTGYPAMQNAMDAVNKGADGYITKPVDMKKLVSVIKKHLKKQDEARKFGERQVKEFIESRVRETEAGK
jgi:DNA-binding NtrC family response regulator